MYQSLATTLWPGISRSGLNKLAIAIAGSILLTLSAKLQVPFWPVPMTMQTFVVLMLGATLGARLAGATVALYIAQGAMGLPVFATGAGLAYLAGPTGGYIFGFLIAATFVGWLSDQGYGRSLITVLMMFAVGETAIYAPGIAWLSTFTGFEKAMSLGVFPFLPAEAVKIALACAVLPVAWKRALKP